MSYENTIILSEAKNLFRKRRGTKHESKTITIIF